MQFLVHRITRTWKSRHMHACHILTCPAKSRDSDLVPCKASKATLKEFLYHFLLFTRLDFYTTQSHDMTQFHAKCTSISLFAGMRVLQSFSTSQCIHTVHRVHCLASNCCAYSCVHLVDIIPVSGPLQCHPGPQQVRLLCSLFCFWSVTCAAMGPPGSL